MSLTQEIFDDVQEDVLAFLAANVGNANVGTDNTTPTSSDSALGAQVFEDSIDDTDTTQSDRVTFSLQIGSGEANGNTLAEAGLEDITGALWLRELLNSIAKTSDIQLFIDYRIIATVEEVTS